MTPLQEFMSLEKMHALAGKPLPMPQATPRNSPLLAGMMPQPLPLCDHLGGGVGHCTLRTCLKGHGVNAQVKPCVACGPQCNDYDPVALIDPVTRSDADIVIDQGASGIGDGLNGLMAVARLKADNPGKTIAYHVSETAEGFVRHFDGYDQLGRAARLHNELPVRDGKQINLGYMQECFRRVEKPRWERYATNIGAAGVKLPSLREPHRLRELGAGFAGMVMLCPFSTVTSREWPLQHWVTLEKLLTEAGHRTCVVHSDNNRSAKMIRSARLIRESPEKVIGAFMNASCVIGNDSGLAHLAGILGRPTIVLGGKMPVRKIFGCYPKVRCIDGHLACNGCTEQALFDVGCRTLCMSQASITPMEVFMEFLQAQDAENRTLLDERRRAVIADCVQKTWGKDGDLAELGVYRGGVIKLMGETDPDVRIRAFDTFTGIPEDDEHAEGHVKGDFATSFEEVMRHVNNENVVWHVGKFPNTAPYDGESYRVVHVDADTAQSTRAAIEYFSGRMVSGGFMIFDDYGWERCPGVKIAVDAAFPPERISTPAGYQCVVKF